MNCLLICILATEAVHFQNTKGVAKNMGAPLELVASDVLDHYRTYSLLERLLYAPIKLSEQPSFQLQPQSQQLLIEKLVILHLMKEKKVNLNHVFVDTIIWMTMLQGKFWAKNYHLVIEKIWMK